DNLAEYRDPATYDLEDNDYAADRPLIEQWARTLGGPLLDLACGTGRMAIPLAEQGYAVTGVDVVPEMIAWGREKAARAGVTVEWVVADARTFRLGRQFPLCFMLANAFQFFLAREDQEAMLASVRAHLAPEGCFLYETRNPTPRNLQQARHLEPQRYTAQDGRRLTVTERQRYDPMTQIQHYTCDYDWEHPDGRRTSSVRRTALRYVYPREMEALLYHSGLRIHASYGSWQQDPLTADSRSMIYVVRRSDAPA
ncbi:MAG TPA: class I SAM-dependent methyltransferase, partial [Ktedonobacterales bacterium]|nr:class I SAM-dependent methyltransferase [Ktedonobacterales bacterium]